MTDQSDFFSVFSMLANNGATDAYQIRTAHAAGQLSAEQALTCSAILDEHKRSLKDGRKAIRLSEKAVAFSDLNGQINRSGLGGILRATWDEESGVTIGHGARSVTFNRGQVEKLSTLARILQDAIAEYVTRPAEDEEPPSLRVVG